MSPQKLKTMLKRFRENQRLSQAALARESGVAQGYISAIEAGRKTNVGIETLKKLAKALDVPLTDLLS
jgi:transcriptional regulator with XRE-family HTH domain